MRLYPSLCRGLCPVFSSFYCTFPKSALAQPFPKVVSQKCFGSTFPKGCFPKGCYVIILGAIFIEINSWNINLHE